MNTENDNKNQTVRKYFVPTAIVAGALTLGAAFGPTLVSADDSESDTADKAQSSESNELSKDSQDDNEFRGRGHKGHQTDVLIDLGISEEALKSGFEEGKTLAEIASEAGVSESALVDALVKDRLENQPTEAEIREHIQEEVNEKPGEHEGRRGKGKMFDLTEEEKQEFEAAKESGDEDKLKELAESKLAEKVESGDITQDQADKFLSRAGEKGMRGNKR